MKMELMHARILLLLFCSACSLQFSSAAEYDLEDAEQEFERMATASDEELMQAPAPETKLGRRASDGVQHKGHTIVRGPPRFITVSAGEDRKELLKPGMGFRPLPESVQKLFLLGPVITPPTGLVPVRAKLVEMLCHVDRMYVRIRRDFFNTRNAFKDLKLGKCPVNQGTNEHYYFLYLLETDCGFNKQVGEGVNFYFQ